MHEAYQQIGEGNYGFGAFIGGPSKTADIEQALVMGAHGPISMTVFILK
jgi:L-lactate dehydrogenase complex protein LldG